jgi:hypothetical protein
MIFDILGNQKVGYCSSFSTSIRLCAPIVGPTQAISPQLVGISAWRKTILCGGNVTARFQSRAEASWMVRQERKVQCKPWRYR